MTDSPTGAKRIKAGLPPGISVAHKTGTSGEKNGRTAATNDVGLITLPDGRRLALAVFVTDAKAAQETCEAVGAADFTGASRVEYPARRSSGLVHRLRL